MHSQHTHLTYVTVPMHVTSLSIQRQPPHPHEEWTVKTSTLVCWPHQEQIYICWKFNADSSACTQHFNNSNAITSMHNIYEETYFFTKYQETDKSLARPGRKQARKHVRDARDFNNMETRAVIKFFFPPARQGAEGISCHSERNIGLFPSWSG